MINIKREIMNAIYHEVQLEIGEESNPGFRSRVEHDNRVKLQIYELERQTSFPMEYKELEYDGYGYSIDGIPLVPGDIINIREKGTSKPFRFIVEEKTIDDGKFTFTISYLRNFKFKENSMTKALFLGTIQ